MEEELSAVYVRTDRDGRILQCDGGYTLGSIPDLSGWIRIDAGCGDRYNLCQSHYFDALYTEDGIPRYALTGGVPRLRTEAELEADRASMPIVPTLQEQVEELAEQNRMLIECLLEMSQLIYG